MRSPSLLRALPVLLNLLIMNCQAPAGPDRPPPGGQPDAAMSSIDLSMSGGSYPKLLDPCDPLSTTSRCVSKYDIATCQLEAGQYKLVFNKKCATAPLYYPQIQAPCVENNMMDKTSGICGCDTPGAKRTHCSGDTLVNDICQLAGTWETTDDHPDCWRQFGQCCRCRDDTQPCACGTC